MCVYPIILMKVLVMAICAVDMVGIIQADRDRSAFDFMILSLVAIFAEEIMLPHMNIHIRWWEIKSLVQVAVFYRVSTSAVEVSAAAVFPGRDAHTLGNI